MKIVYSCSDRIGAGVQLARFINHMGPEHEIRIAGYNRATDVISHIDWTLDALRHRYCFKNKQELIKLFGYEGLPHVGFKELSILFEDINDYCPDIVICDGEPIVAHIASVLGFRLWYCSALHLLDGIKWGWGTVKYRSHLEKYRILLSKMPKAERKFIYSPFGDLVDGPELKNGYEWMKPYHIGGVVNKLDKAGGVAIIGDKSRLSILSKILNCVPPFDLTMLSHHDYNLSHLNSINSLNDNNIYRNRISSSDWIFTTGETSVVADAMYAGAKICIAPDLKDPEALLNAILVQNYGIGDDVSQVELMGSGSVNIIEKSYLSCADVNYTMKKPYKEEMQLHLELEKLCM